MSTSTSAGEDFFVLSGGERLRVFLANDCRPDARDFDTARPVTLSPGE
jgi:hypothetical protein